MTWFRTHSSVPRQSCRVLRENLLLKRGYLQSRPTLRKIICARENGGRSTRWIWQEKRHEGIRRSTLEKFLSIQQSATAGAFELREHIHFCFTCIGKSLPIDQQLAILLKEVFDFTIGDITSILEMSAGTVKHALLRARKTMRDVFDERCALINKAGVCHQCSELNGIFNPKQDFQEQKLKTGLHDDLPDTEKEHLFELRMRISKAIDPMTAAAPIFNSFILITLRMY
jgi:hypothetical protein